MGWFVCLPVLGGFEKSVFAVVGHGLGVRLEAGGELKGFVGEGVEGGVIEGVGG